MKRKRWQPSSNAPQLPTRSRFTTSTSSLVSNFADLPSDILNKIAAPFYSPELKSASSVCKSWRHALEPLREAMKSFIWGKRSKDGTNGVAQNSHQALDDYFLKGVSLGSIPCMTEAGVVYSKLGEVHEAISMYRRAAELGDPISQRNLEIFLLTTDPGNPKDAVRWLRKASVAGGVRAQYMLAVCLENGDGVKQNLSEAAKWYRQAAEGGYVRAMYYLSRCYCFGRGLPQSNQRARIWMERAADCGYSKAQEEHGLTLLSHGHKEKAAVFLELATRGGQTSAANTRDMILAGMSISRRAYVRDWADYWQPQRRLQVYFPHL